MQKRIKIVENNGVLRLPIYEDMAEHLGIKAGDEIIAQDDEGKHGRFISFWKPRQQRKKQAKKYTEKKEV